MGCNAWNHAPDCSCGWGGTFYGQGYRDGAGDSWHWQRSDSYTVPNARCPKCSVNVYFYRSPFGGTVYFDDLGPPWPKHPCMDLGRSPSTVRPQRFPAVTAGSRPAAASKREPGWRPMICDELHRHPRCDKVIVLKVQSGPGGAQTLYAVADRTLLDHRTPFLARLRQDGSVEVSTLNTLVQTPGEIRFIAFASLDGLPQPLQNEAKGIHVVKPSIPPAAGGQRPQALPQPASAPPKKPRPDPKSIPVTVIRSRRPDQVKPKTAKPRAGRQDTVIEPPPTESAASPKGGTPRRSVPPRGQYPRQETRSEQARPLTNMALAFQKLASSDPDVEDLLISGVMSRGVV